MQDGQGGTVSKADGRDWSAGTDVFAWTGREGLWRACVDVENGFAPMALV